MDETFAVFLRAAGFGLAVAAPVGPMSLLVMRRTLSLGWRQGLATGGGIATADGLYATLAALGLASVSAFLLDHARPLHALAGLVLIWLGLRTLRARPPEAGPAARPATPAACYAGAVLLTLSNPPTILLFAAFFTALSPPSGFDAGVARATVAGVVCGSLGWWCALVAALAGLARAIPSAARFWIDHVAGSALLLYGALQLVQAL